MYTKSKIQVLNEAIRVRNEFKDALNDVMDKFVVEDAIFAYHNGRVVEVVDGYFCPQNEYKDLYEAVSSGINKGVRVINNETFVSGDIYEMLCMCPEGSKIVDIKTLNEIG